VPAVLLGTVVPLAVGLALGDPARIGRSIGRLYAVNSAGSILGPVVAGFLVLPRVGSEWALRGHALIYALLAVPLLWVVRRGRPPAEGRRRAAVVLALAGAGVLASALMPRWDPRPLTSGANVYFTAGFRGYDRLLHFRESVSGGVTTVVEKDGVRTLLSNGKFQGTTGPESFFQTTMALVPMTQLRRTERGLNIGLGTGQTLATMAAAPFARIDVAEISPDVVEAARWYFSGLHRGSIDDPRVHVSYADGRNFLMVQAAQARYDLIAVQLNSIWLAGAAALYSREFYQLCLRRLADGGILQQWLQLHHMRWEDIVTVMATMADVFPQVALWQFGHQAIVLGSNRPLLADHARLRALEPRLKAAGALDGFASPRVLAAFAYHHLDDAAFRALLRDAIPKERAAEFISSDLRPRLEYGTPRGVTETDSAALFHRRTRPYSFAPLEALIAGVPPGEKAAALQAIDDERRAALPGETRKKVVAPAIEGHP
jgi:spermidine synthase